VTSPIAGAALAELAEAPDGTMSLPRLCKRLGVNASVLLRELTLVGEAKIGGVAGPGLVRVERINERWMVHLTEAGLMQARSAP
jgi:hypothetical protein